MIKQVEVKKDKKWFKMKNVSKILETLGFKFDYEKNAKGKRIRMYWINKSTLIE